MALSDADILFQQALVHHQAGRKAEAVAAYQQVLELAPGHAPARAMLGSIASREPAGSSDSPSTDDALLQDGRALVAQRKFAQAVEQFRKALAKSPGSVELALDLAEALLGEICQDDDLDFAEVEAHPESLAAANRLGKNLTRHRKLQAEAQSLCRGAIARQPDLVRAYITLGEALTLGEGNDTEAAEVFRKALELDPKNGMCRYRLSLLTGDPLDTMPAEAVQSIFDRGADSFEAELKRLQYTVPARLRTALGPPGPLAERVADLGCGTGWCGPLFREGAKRLVGVDLSGPMLAKARQRGVYDELQQADLHEFLLSEPAAFDLILAADVLIYVGDLARMFPAVQSALAPSGRFAFSTEKGIGDSYRFLPSGRFQHDEPYIRRLASECRLTVEQCRDIPIRLSQKGPIAGQLFVLRKG